jgi:hypothetical protein
MMAETIYVPKPPAVSRPAAGDNVMVEGVVNTVLSVTEYWDGRLVVYMRSAP